MNLSKQQFIVFILFVITVSEAYPCVGPYNVVSRFSDRNIYNNFTREEKSIEKYLDKKFGQDGWEYDDENFRLNLPNETSGRFHFPVKVGYGNQPISNGTSEIRVYAKEQIRVKEENNKSNRNNYTAITQLATFKFHETAFPFVATRLTFVPTEILAFIFVYVPSDPGERLKVIKHEKYYNLNGNCVFTEFVKGNNKYLERYGLQKYDFSGNKRLNPNNDIPTDKFRLAYFDTSKPYGPILTDYTDDIVVNQTHRFTYIDLKDFGAYWVGNLTVDKAKTLQFNIRYSYSIAKIKLDGSIIFQSERNGSANRKVLVDVDKGIHKIEVEFISNYFSPNFSVVITPEIKYHRLDELKDEAKFEEGEYTIWYAGVYGSDNPDNIIYDDNSINVTLNKSASPVIILLQSMRSVKWRIKNPFNNKIKAVIVGRSQHGSQVVGDISQESIYFIRERLGTDTMFPDTFIGKDINGYTGIHKATNLEILD